MKKHTDCPIETEPFVLSRIKLSMFFAIFAAASALVTYILYTQWQIPTALPLAQLLSWPLLFGVLALLLVYFSSDGLRLHFTLRALGYRIHLREIIPLVFINLFVSNVTPMATGGGVAQVWYLRRHQVPVGAATAATTIRTLLAVAFIFLPAPFLLLSMDALQKTPLFNHFSGYLAVFAGIYVAFFAVVLLRIRWLVLVLFACIDMLKRVRLVSEGRRGRWRYRILREMMHFTAAFTRFFKGNGVDVGAAVIFTAVFLLCLFSFPALILWGLGQPIDYLTSLGLLVVTTFIMYFSPTPGATGVAEGVFVVFFHRIVPPEFVLLTMIAWRFLTIYLGVLIGIPVIWKAVFGKRRLSV